MAKRKLGPENPWHMADTTVGIVSQDVALAEIRSSPSVGIVSQDVALAEIRSSPSLGSR